MFNRFTKDFMQQEERNDYLLQLQQEWMRICIRNRASYIIKAVNGDISRCCKMLSPLCLFCNNLLDPGTSRNGGVT